MPKTSTTGENLTLMQQEIDKLVQKRAIAPVHSTSVGFYSRLFLVPKKGGSFRPVIDLSHLNKFITNEHFQMENLMCLKHLLNPNDYMVKLDLKDAYLTVGVHPHSQQFLRFIWQGQIFSVPSPTVRTKHSAKNVYEAVKTCDSVSSHSKYQTAHLSGRHTDHRVIHRNAKGSHNSGNRLVAIPRIYNQLREVGLDAFPRTRIPGVLDKLENNEFLPTSGEDSKSTQCRQIFNAEEPNVITSSLPVPGLSRILPPSSLGGSTSLQTPTKLPYTASSVEQGVISGHGPPRPPSSGGTPVVDHQHQTGEWEPNTASSDRNDDHLGRLQNGVGCHLRQSVHQRTLVESGKPPPYQCLGAESDLFTSFPETPVESIGETPPRQHNGNCLYQQPRRYSFTQSHVIDTRTVELVPSTEHFDHCRTPSGCPQCSGRQRAANICRLERLETSTTNVTTFSQGQRDRPLCHKANQSVKALCELAPRPTCCGHGRIFHRLEPTERIRVPTIQPYPKNINESDKRQREPSTSSPAQCGKLNIGGHYYYNSQSSSQYFSPFLQLS